MLNILYYIGEVEVVPLWYLSIFRDPELPEPLMHLQFCIQAALQYPSIFLPHTRRIYVYLPSDVFYSVKLSYTQCHESFFLVSFSASKSLRIFTEERMQRSLLLTEWTEWIQFLVALANLHQDNWKNRMICTRTIWRIGWIHHILPIVLVQNS